MPKKQKDSLLLASLKNLIPFSKLKKRAEFFTTDIQKKFSDKCHGSYNKKQCL